MDAQKWKTQVYPIILEKLVVYAERNIKPTLRTLWYTLVSMGILVNHKSQYKDLSERTARAREAELTPEGSAVRTKFNVLPMDCFADTSRRIVKNFDDEYKTVEEYMDFNIEIDKELPERYPTTIPIWKDQPHYVEVWVEKEALGTTFEAMLNGKQITVVPVKGFSSKDYINRNILYLKKKLEEGKKIHVLYFGDLDAWGEEIEKDILNSFKKAGVYGQIDFKKLGLLEEHVEKYNLPNDPDPTKVKGKMLANFLARHGGKDFQVEVDALVVYAFDDLKELVNNAVDQYYDPEIYEELQKTYDIKEGTKTLLEKVRELKEYLEGRLEKED